MVDQPKRLKDLLAREAKLRNDPSIIDKYKDWQPSATYDARTGIYTDEAAPLSRTQVDGCNI